MRPLSVYTAKDFLIYHNIVGRITEDYRKQTFTIRVHPMLIFLVQESLSKREALGTQLIVKEMRLRDYWVCRKKLVVVDR